MKTNHSIFPMHRCQWYPTCKLTEEIISVCKLLAASIVVIWLQGIHSLVNCNLPAKVLKQHLITIRLNFMAKQNECFSK